MEMTFDSIVAGAGIWGCTVARRLAEAGQRVLVLEKRPVVGGNCRCEIDSETGIEVHAYGSHIFHTGNGEVWAFVKRFTAFNDYRHSVLAKCRNKIYHLPIGCTLLREFFGREMKPSELNEADRKALFDAFIRGYTSKQWGVAPEKVDPSIIARLKVRDNDSTDYFDDPHQGIPADGYNAMFERMLDHPNVTVQCNCALTLSDGEARVKGEGEEWINSLLSSPANDRSDRRTEESKGRKIYYSGPIDALFDYKFGALPWRTLRFERETVPVADYQGNSVVNYTDVDVPYTRIHEFKHYHPEWTGTAGVENGRRCVAADKTIVMREYSATWQPGDEPYYPISSPDAAALLAKYQAELDHFNRMRQCADFHAPLQVGGRLGQYRYFDMDKSIEAALSLNL